MGTMVRVSNLGEAGAEEPAAAPPLAGAFAGEFDPAAGLFAFVPGWAGVFDEPEAGLFAFVPDWTGVFDEPEAGLFAFVPGWAGVLDEPEPGELAGAFAGC